MGVFRLWKRFNDDVSMSSFRNKLVGIFPKSLNRFPSFVCGTFLFQISISPTFKICCFEACFPQKYCFLLAFRMFSREHISFLRHVLHQRYLDQKVCLISNKTSFFNHQISCFNGSSQSSHKLFQVIRYQSKKLFPRMYLCSKIRF